MDQVTQAVLGGVAAQIVCGKSLGKRAWVVGAVGGLLPDADFLLSGFADPAFPIEMHRTWTHALAITPIGALLAMLCFLPRRWYRERWRAVYVAAFVGWLTHGPLDACTSYGTKIWLPFSDAWVAWDLISIIDPVFTGILITGLVLAVRRARPRPAVIAFGLCLLYLGLGMVQRNRALDVQRQLAEARGHHYYRGRAIPMLGSIVLWRSIYLGSPTLTRSIDDGSEYLWADAVALPPLLRTRVQPKGWGRYPVGIRAWLDMGDELPAELRVKAEERGVDLRQKIRLWRRFWDFADGYVVRTSSGVGDARYCVDYGFDAIWGVGGTGTGPDRRLGWFDQRRQWGRRLGSVVRHSLGLEGTWLSLEDVLKR